jgi:hypothetical protein
VENQERIDALRLCEGQYRESLLRLNALIVETPEPERAPLLERQRFLDRRLEQTEIEIEFLIDRSGLVERCTRRRDIRLADALREPDPQRRKAIEARAAFYEEVIDEVLTKTQTVFPIDETSLRTILADLSEAAREAKTTVDSINRSISIVNRVLDGLLQLARAAAKLAV